MSFFRRFWNERLRQAYVAMALAVFAGLIALLKPLDIAIWASQSKLVDHAASGEIVLVEVGSATAADDGRTNEAVAQAVSSLKAAGAERIFVNVPLKRSDNPKADERLRGVLQTSRESVFLGDPGDRHDTSTFTAMRNDPYFKRGIETFDNRYEPDFLQFVWEIPSIAEDGRTTLAFALADHGSDRDYVSIDSSIDSRTIPKVNYRDIAATSDAVGGADNAYIIVARGAENEVRLAKNGYGPATLAHVLAAETLARGSGQSLPFWMPAIVASVLLVTGLLLTTHQRTRRFFYAITCLTLISLIGFAGVKGVQVPFSYAVMVLVTYGTARTISNFRNKHLYVDSVSGTPNFSALLRDMQGDATKNPRGIVVVKVLRLDALFSQLGLRQKRQYLQQIARRLRLADHSTKVYFDNGKYFALVVNDLGSKENFEHLSGLRAIVSQAVSVGDSTLDVAITVGADFTNVGTVESRLSAATSAADQAREAFRPVFVIGGSDKGDEQWDHSLTARLSEALAQDRIKMKLQPQIELQSGEWVGAEALARWKDEDGREIPPDKFISQCEQMGRLDDLTKRMLEKGIEAALELNAIRHDFSISVNVSAVQLVDDRIAEIVEAAILRSGIDPSLIRLEITETARIEDYGTAARVMERLREQGLSFSLDDFGVGSASHEAFLKLPFQEVKIDRLFIQQLTTSRTARSIVEGVLGTCQTTDVMSVAEGIEDAETQRLLREMGCTYGQGFFIAKPQWVSQLVGHLSVPKGQMFQRM